MNGDLKNYVARYNLLFKRALKRVEWIYNLDSLSINNIANEIFIKQFKHVIKKSDYYKKLYTNYGLNDQSIKTIEDLRKLPIVTKEDIKTKIEDIYTGNRLLKSTSHTSGTTGTPLTVYRDYNAVIMENAYSWFYRIRNGYALGDRAISLRGSLMKDQIKHFDRYLNILYLSGYNINEQYIDLYYNEIIKFNPKAIIGYPSSLHALALELERKNHKVNIPLAFTSSENLFNFQLHKIQQILNSKVFDWYGNAERTIALEQCVQGIYHETPLYGIVEYYDDHIITTSLISKHFPLIRYKVNDMIKPAEYKNHECGLLTKSISSIDGRSNDYIFLKDGSIVNRLNQAFKNISNVLFIQVIQDNFKNIKINVVPDKGFSDKDRSQILHSIYIRAGEKIKADIHTISENELVKSKSGKFNLVINNARRD
jgi:phenylacetate-CoA ligase